MLKARSIRYRRAPFGRRLSSHARPRGRATHLLNCQLHSAAFLVVGLASSETDSSCERLTRLRNLTFGVFAPVGFVAGGITAWFSFFYSSQTLLWTAFFLLVFASWGLGFIGLGLATLLTKKRTEQWRKNISEGLLRLISKTFPPASAVALFPVLVVPYNGELPSAARLLQAALTSAVLAAILYVGLAYAAKMEKDSQQGMEKIVLVPLKSLRPHVETALKPLNSAPGKAINVPLTHDPALVTYACREGEVRIRRLGATRSRIELLQFRDWSVPASLLDEQLIHAPRSGLRKPPLSEPSR